MSSAAGSPCPPSSFLNESYNAIKIRIAKIFFEKRISQKIVLLDLIWSVTSEGAHGS